MNRNKFTCIINIIVLTFAFSTLVGCFSIFGLLADASESKKERDGVPLRTYSLENTTDLSIDDLYVVNKEYEKDGFVPNKNSAILTVSALISEYEADSMSTAAKVKLYNVMTRSFPKNYDSYKEIVIPKFRDTSGDEETIPVEQNDAYMFIIPIVPPKDVDLTNIKNRWRIGYTIQTNTRINLKDTENKRGANLVDNLNNWRIGIESVNNNKVGYISLIDVVPPVSLVPQYPYFVGEIPREESAILSFVIKPQTEYMFYLGVRKDTYVPIVATEDGSIRNDKNLKVILSEKSIQTIYDEAVANRELVRLEITDESIRAFMDKVSILSYSYYEFLLGNIPKAQQYYDESLKIELSQTGIPEDGIRQVRVLTKNFDIESPQTEIPEDGISQVRGLTKMLKIAFEINEALK